MGHFIWQTFFLAAVQWPGKGRAKIILIHEFGCSECSAGSPENQTSAFVAQTRASSMNRDESFLLTVANDICIISLFGLWITELSEENQTDASGSDSYGDPCNDCVDQIWKL